MAKLKAVALKAGAFSGLLTFQLPLHSSTGCNCPFFSTVATRIPFHFDAVAIVSLAPAIGQFYLQNPDTRYKLGGYPLINGYINLHLKRTRIFVQMYNLLQRTGEKSYFLAPHYPLNPRILKVGLSWNFFD